MSCRKPSRPAREPGRRIPGIEYQDRAPGIATFMCPAYSCRVSPSSCASRWRRAEEFASMSGRALMTAKLSDIEARGASPKMGCATGAQHAGQASSRRSAMVKWPTLRARCGYGNTRIVSGRICNSCFNRGAEFLRGRNGRGDAPILATPVQPRPSPTASAPR